MMIGCYGNPPKTEWLDVETMGEPCDYRTATETFMSYIRQRRHIKMSPFDGEMLCTICNVRSAPTLKFGVSLYNVLLDHFLTFQSIHWHQIKMRVIKRKVGE